MGLDVLITNIGFNSPSGTTLYVRDLALELQRCGHRPAIFTLEMGRMSAELQAAGILVTNRLGKLTREPDVIHGHHYFPTLAAMKYFPDVPALHICHDYSSQHDRTPLHPRIYRYYGVSKVCMERLVREGVTSNKVEFTSNFVDMERFQPRPLLPKRPRRALVFSNYAHAGTHLPAVAAACLQTGLELDVVGAGAGNSVERPEAILGQYDLIFAKGKAAMEAMAVGAAVILCDASGVGPLVSAVEFEALRPLNFGFQAMCRPLRAEFLVAQIAAYDPVDATAVRDLLRSSAGLDRAVQRLITSYHEVIAEHQARPQEQQEGHITIRLWRQRLFLKLVIVWLALPAAQRAYLKKLPAFRAASRRIKAFLFETW